jgi:sterol desaturase/sphingolipid hydroxylase (fatty acid hydroxylase superfamily)
MEAMPKFPSVTQLAVPLFIGLVLLEVAFAKFRGTARYETRDTLASLVMGTGSIISGMLVGFIGYQSLLYFWQFRLFEPGLQPWVFVVCFILDDLRYYWFHRIAHRVRWVWASHVNHHTSQHYNLSTALRQTWTGVFTGIFILNVPLVLLGFHPAMIAFVNGFNLVYQFWIHTETIRRLPKFIEAIFNTPSHHRVHHGTNAQYLDANYAGTLIIWDHLFGSFVPEDDDAPVKYGIVRNLATFNPLKIAFHEWINMGRDFFGRRLSIPQRLAYLFAPPGWSHDHSRRTSHMIKADHVQRHPEMAGQPGLPDLPSAVENRS